MIGQVAVWVGIWLVPQTAQSQRDHTCAKWHIRDFTCFAFAQLEDIMMRHPSLLLSLVHNERRGTVEAKQPVSTGRHVIHNVYIVGKQQQ